MTARSVPMQATEEYRAKTPQGAPSERVRVALVGGSGSVATDDLYPLLRRRLLILTSILACACFLMFCLEILVRTTLPMPAERTGITLEWLVSSWRGPRYEPWIRMSWRAGFRGFVRISYREAILRLTLGAAAIVFGTVSFLSKARPLKAGHAR